jgi:hypothetical protein
VHDPTRIESEVQQQSMVRDGGGPVGVSTPLRVCRPSGDTGGSSRDVTARRR